MLRGISARSAGVELAWRAIGNQLVTERG